MIKLQEIKTGGRKSGKLFERGIVKKYSLGNNFREQYKLIHWLGAE